MTAKSVKFSTPLKIDVQQLLNYLPQFQYQGPYSAEKTAEYILDYTSSDIHVFVFDNKINEEFNTFGSDYSPRELSFLFSRLPEEISNRLRQALKGTSLEIPTLSDEEINAEWEVQEIRRHQNFIKRNGVTTIKDIEAELEFVKQQIRRRELLAQDAESNAFLYLNMANQAPQIDGQLANSSNDSTTGYATAIFVLAAFLA